MSEELTKEQVNYAVEFARSLADVKNQFGIFTPDLLHNLMVDLNVNPTEATYDKIVKALNQAKNSAPELQGYSEWMEYNDMLYKRTLRYYANMLSFDYYYTSNCPQQDMSKKAYQDDKAIVEKFMRSFDYKAEFSNMLIEMLRRETVFTWLRTTNGTMSEDNEINTTKASKYTLQIMPQKYCKSVGYFEKSGILYDFDMNYFLKAGVDIEGFDPTFMTKYKEIFTDGGINNYDPQNPFNKRNGTFAYWVQTSPDDGAWVFKMDTSNFNSVPFLAPLLQNVINDREMAALQKNKNIISAYALLIGELKMLDKQQSGNVKDAFAIDPKTLGYFMQLVKQGLQDSIKVGAMPTENAKLYQYQDYVPDMSVIQNNASANLGVGASKLIYANEKMSQSESEAAIMNDFMTMAKIYPQFSHFLEFFINKKTRKYQFHFVFKGSPYIFERQQRQKEISDLADKGIVLGTPAWACAYGYDPFDFDRLLDQAKGENFTDKLTQLISIHTASGSNESKGRPLKDRVSTDSREYDDSNG